MRPHSDQSPTQEDFTRELGLTDAEFAAELFTASGGRLSLSRTAVDVAARTTMPVDFASPSFADYVAGLTPDFGIGASAGDAWVAAVLSHLRVFTKQTALLALSAMSPEAIGNVDLRDSEGILMRLRLEGVLVPTGTVSRPQALQVPALLAAKLRHDLRARTDEDSVVAALVVALIDHMENSQQVDPEILAEALVLARRAGLWFQLGRIGESVGLPMFLVAPREACSAFGHLPVAALQAEPELGFLSMLTDDVLDRSTNGLTPDEVRGILVEETRAGRLRQYFPASATREDPLARSAHDAGSPQLDNGDDAAVGGTAFATGAPAHRGGSIGIVRQMLTFGLAGDHAQAAALGKSWGDDGAPRRTQLLIRLLTAVSLFHAAEFQRSLSLLYEIEDAAADAHVDGDFLLPAVTAWTALTAMVSGDHERADRRLASLAEEFASPLIVDELVHPPALVASALRALDRLDLEKADEDLQQLTAFPENRSLWVYLPVISRTIALLGSTSRSGLLFVNDDVEKYRHSAEVSLTGKDLLAASRSQVYIGLGQLKWAELELRRLSSSTDLRTVLNVRLELVAGRNESAIALVDTWFYHQSLTPRSRAELAAIKAAALLRLGQDAAAAAEFTTAVGLSAWVKSLLPLVFLPRQDRDRLIDLSSGDVIFDELFSAFSGHFWDKSALMTALRTVGEISVGEASVPQLTSAEAQLLDLLSQGLSIVQISAALHQVPGTVKNRLSALYRKFEVSSKGEVVNRARSLGFLLPG